MAAAHASFFARVRAAASIGEAVESEQNAAAATAHAAAPPVHTGAHSPWEDWTKAPTRSGAAIAATEESCEQARGSIRGPLGERSRREGRSTDL